ncbi:phosphoserine phosphatase, chloroplastic-like [Primulina tabacum]|uniref:phosphoserine phosphatase, chloroplastic-like n=1 Tax=Primulina tabacum TaxID=48773 RepID=UPI003F5922C8
MEHFDNTGPSKEILEVWRAANAVCFDVDSTVCLDEGIDELAEFCRAVKAVADWTARAVSGSVTQNVHVLSVGVINYLPHAL